MRQKFVQANIRRVAVLCGLLLLGVNASAGAPAPAISFDMKTNWQPPGGAFRFTVTPVPESTAPLPVVYLCPQLEGMDFYFTAGGELNPVDEKGKTNNAALACTFLTVKRLAPDNATNAVPGFEAALPAEIASDFVNQTKPYFSAFDLAPTRSSFRQLIAEGHLRVHVNDKTHAWFDVGLTSRKFASFITLVAVAALLWGLAQFVRRIRVSGGDATTGLQLASLPIRLISKSDGRASLSQFQMMLWTFVVVGGAIYVVMLNGSLIPISDGTLVLLGISGLALVLAKTKDESTQNTGGQMPTPKPVQNLVVQAIKDSTDLLVTWTPPLDRAPISHYVVTYSKVKSDNSDPSKPQLDGAGNLSISDSGVIPIVREAGVRLVSLDPQVLYHVSVCAANPGGLGESSDVDDVVKKKVTMSGEESKPANPGASPPHDVQLRAVLDAVTESVIELEWVPADGNSIYEVQFRRSDSRDDWSRACQEANNPNHKSAIVRGLDSGVVYQFRLRRQGDQGYQGLWSKPERAATMHVPRWSDLVTDPDRPAEIDVTRAQMLLFTNVCAAFVALKIADVGTIPDIPPQYVYLMGITNSVYITSKWVRR